MDSCRSSSLDPVPSLTNEHIINDGCLLQNKRNYFQTKESVINDYDLSNMKGSDDSDGDLFAEPSMSNLELKNHLLLLQERVNDILTHCGLDKFDSSVSSVNLSESLKTEYYQITVALKELEKILSLKKKHFYSATFSASSPISNRQIHQLQKQIHYRDSLISCLCNQLKILYKANDQLIIDYKTKENLLSSELVTLKRQLEEAKTALKNFPLRYNCNTLSYEEKIDKELLLFRNSLTSNEDFISNLEREVDRLTQQNHYLKCELERRNENNLKPHFKLVKDQLMTSNNQSQIYQLDIHKEEKLIEDFRKQIQSLNEDNRFKDKTIDDLKVCLNNTRYPNLFILVEKASQTTESSYSDLSALLGAVQRHLKDQHPNLVYLFSRDSDEFKSLESFIFGLVNLVSSQPQPNDNIEIFKEFLASEVNLKNQMVQFLIINKAGNSEQIENIRNQISYLLSLDVDDCFKKGLREYLHQFYRADNNIRLAVEHLVRSQNKMLWKSTNVSNSLEEFPSKYEKYLPTSVNDSYESVERSTFLPKPTKDTQNECETKLKLVEGELRLISGAYRSDKDRCTKELQEKEEVIEDLKRKIESLQKQLPSYYMKSVNSQNLQHFKLKPKEDDCSIFERSQQKSMIGLKTSRNSCLEAQVQEMKMKLSEISSRFYSDDKVSKNLYERCLDETNMYKQKIEVLENLNTLLITELNDKGRPLEDILEMAENYGEQRTSSRYNSGKEGRSTVTHEVLPKDEQEYETKPMKSNYLLIEKSNLDGIISDVEDRGGSQHPRSSRKSQRILNSQRSLTDHNRSIDDANNPSLIVGGKSVEKINQEIKNLYSDFEDKNNKLKEYSLNEIKDRDKKLETINFELKLKNDQIQTVTIENRRLSEKIETESQKSNRYEQIIALKEELLKKLMKEREKIRTTLVTELRERNDELKEKGKTVYFLNAELHRVSSDLEILNAELHSIKTSDKFNVVETRTIEIREKELSTLKEENTSLKFCVNLKMAETEAIRSELKIQQVGNQELYKENKALRSKINDDEDRISYKLSEVESVTRNTIDGLKRQLNKDKEEFFRMSEVKMRLEKTIHELKTNNISLKGAMERLENEKNEYKEEIQMLQEKINNLMTHINEPKQRLSKVSDYGVREPRVTKDGSDIRTENLSLKKEIEVLRSMVLKLEERNKVNLERMEDSNSRIKEDERKLRSVKIDNEGMLKELKQYKHLEVQLDECIKRKAMDYEDLRKENEELLRRMEGYQQEVYSVKRDAEEKCEVLQQNLDDTSQLLNIAEEKLANCNHQWRDKCGKMIEAYDQMNNSYLGQKAEFDMIKQNYDTLERRLSSQHRDFMCLRRENEQLLEKCSQLERDNLQMSLLDGEVNSLRRQNMQMRSQIETLNVELESAHSEICNASTKIEEDHLTIVQLCSKLDSNIKLGRRYRSQPLLSCKDYINPQLGDCEEMEYNDLEIRYNTLSNQVQDILSELRLKDRKIAWLVNENEVNKCKTLRYEHLKEDYRDLEQRYRDMEEGFCKSQGLLRDNCDLQDTIENQCLELQRLEYCNKLLEEDYEMCCERLRHAETRAEVNTELLDRKEDFLIGIDEKERLKEELNSARTALAQAMDNNINLEQKVDNYEQNEKGQSETIEKIKTQMKNAESLYEAELDECKRDVARLQSNEISNLQLQKQLDDQILYQKELQREYENQCITIDNLSAQRFEERESIGELRASNQQLTCALDGSESKIMQLHEQIERLNDLLLKRGSEIKECKRCIHLLEEHLKSSDRDKTSLLDRIEGLKEQLVCSSEELDVCCKMMEKLKDERAALLEENRELNTVLYDKDQLLISKDQQSDQYINSPEFAEEETESAHMKVKKGISEKSLVSDITFSSSRSVSWKITHTERTESVSEGAIELREPIFATDTVMTNVEVTQNSDVISINTISSRRYRQDPSSKYADINQRQSLSKDDGAGILKFVDIETKATVTLGSQQNVSIGFHRHSSFDFNDRVATKEDLNDPGSSAVFKMLKSCNVDLDYKEKDESDDEYLCRIMGRYKEFEQFFLASMKILFGQTLDDDTAKLFVNFDDLVKDSREILNDHCLNLQKMGKYKREIGSVTVESLASLDIGNLTDLVNRHQRQISALGVSVNNLRNISSSNNKKPSSIKVVSLTIPYKMVLEAQDLCRPTGATVSSASTISNVSKYSNVRPSELVITHGSSISVESNEGSLNLSVKSVTTMKTPSTYQVASSHSIKMQSPESREGSVYDNIIPNIPSDGSLERSVKMSKTSDMYNKDDLGQSFSIKVHSSVSRIGSNNDEDSLTATVSSTENLEISIKRSKATSDFQRNFSTSKSSNVELQSPESRMDEPSEEDLQKLSSKEKIAISMTPRMVSEKPTYSETIELSYVQTFTSESNTNGTIEGTLTNASILENLSISLQLSKTKDKRSSIDRSQAQSLEKYSAESRTSRPQDNTTHNISSSETSQVSINLSTEKGKSKEKDNAGTQSLRFSVSVSVKREKSEESPQKFPSRGIEENSVNVDLVKKMSSSAKYKESSPTEYQANESREGSIYGDLVNKMSTESSSHHLSQSVSIKASIHEGVAMDFAMSFESVIHKESANQIEPVFKGSENIRKSSASDRISSINVNLMSGADKTQIRVDVDSRVDGQESISMSFKASLNSVKSRPTYLQGVSESLIVGENQTENIDILEKSLSRASVALTETEMHQLGDINFDNLDPSINIKDRIRIYSAEIDYLNEKNSFTTYAVNLLTNPDRYSYDSDFVENLSESLMSKAKVLQKLQKELKFDPHLSPTEKALISKILNSNSTYKQLFNHWIDLQRIQNAKNLDKAEYVQRQLEQCLTSKVNEVKSLEEEKENLRLQIVKMNEIVNENEMLKTQNSKVSRLSDDKTSKRSIRIDIGIGGSSDYVNQPPLKTLPLKHDKRMSKNITSVLKTPGKMVTAQEIMSAIEMETSIENLRSFAKLLAEDNFDLTNEIEKLLKTIEELRRQLKANCELLAETVGMLQNSQTSLSNVEKKLTLEVDKSQLISKRVERLNEFNKQIVVELQRLLKENAPPVPSNMDILRRCHYILACLKTIEAEMKSLQDEKQKSQADVSKFGSLVTTPQPNFAGPIDFEYQSSLLPTGKMSGEIDFTHLLDSSKTFALSFNVNPEKEGKGMNLPVEGASGSHFLIEQESSKSQKRISRNITENNSYIYYNRRNQDKRNFNNNCCHGNDSFSDVLTDKSTANTSVGEQFPPMDDDTENESSSNETDDLLEIKELNTHHASLFCTSSSRQTMESKAAYKDDSDLMANGRLSNNRVNLPFRSQLNIRDHKWNSLCSLSTSSDSKTRFINYRTPIYFRKLGDYPCRF